MKNETQMETVAAPAADPGPVIPVFTTNPLVALAMALIGPILGLFRRRANPTAAGPHPQPATPAPATSGPLGPNRPTSAAPAPDASERRAVAVRAYTRSTPVGRTAAQKGGSRHG